MAASNTVPKRRGGRPSIFAQSRARAPVPMFRTYSGDDKIAIPRQSSAQTTSIRLPGVPCSPSGTAQSITGPTADTSTPVPTAQSTNSARLDLVDGSCNLELTDVMPELCTMASMGLLGDGLLVGRRSSRLLVLGSYK